MNDFPPMTEWRERQARLQHLLREQGLDGCLITQNVSIFYWTGSMQSGYVFVPVEGESCFFVRRSLSRAITESRVPTMELGSFRSFGAKLAGIYPALFGVERRPLIGTDMDVLPAQTYTRLTEAVSSAVWCDASALLRTIRSVKSAYEVDFIEKAAAAAARAMTRALTVLREGVTELELMAEVEHSLRLDGHIGLMRMRGYNQEIMTGIVAAGEAAAEPSYFDGPAGGRGLGPASPKSVSRRPITRNEPILLDVGCCIDGYTIDQTRTAVIGQLSAPLLSAYETSVSILRHVESLLRPGTTPSFLYAEALRLADEAGLAGHFMGFGADQVRFLGHGIGLEIDEWPVLAKGFDEPLLPGMVLAIEPKFTFPGEGVVGIENTYVITHEGFRKLSNFPETLMEVP